MASPFKKKVTLKFLAEHLGLSRTTVSIVLNDSPTASTIAAKTRERILKAAKEFQYKPNFFAKSLNDGRSFLIGVLTPDLAEGYSAAVLAGIEDYLLHSEYHFFIASHQWSDSRIIRTAELFRDRGAEGVILVNSSHFPNIDMPTVGIGRPEPGFKGTSILLDNRAGVRAALQHLVELGHKNIAFMRGHMNSADTESRWQAVQVVARELSIRINPALVVQLERLGTQYTAPIEEGMRCADQLIRHRGHFTALVAFNDMSAIGAMHRFRDSGWNIPQEISIVGFDDVVEASITYPTLTTVQQPLQAMGETAAREIIEAITNGSKSKELLFAPKLVVRNSSTFAPSSRKFASASR